MWAILKHRDFARLFSAQVVALIGTGLMTVALGLLAYDLAGPQAGAVLGTAYAIKMVAYVGLAPIMGAVVARFRRKTVLIFVDIVRVGIAACLPFVETVGQVYLLIFVLQTASATFTPTFQSAIPDILQDEAEYTRALSLSRLAYDLENLLSPALAGILLLVMSFSGLFVGTALGFVASACLIWKSTIPQNTGSQGRTFKERATRGIWIYLNTPRLRGLLGFNLAAASVSAFVLVNTVIIVRGVYTLDETALALAMGTYGAGSMVAAFALPWMLDRVPDRTVMTCAAILLSMMTLLQAVWLAISGPLEWTNFLGAWFLSGMLYSAILTPSGRLLRRSAQPEDRPAVFTAQFALSHACWLVTYPTAGYLAVWGGLWLSLGAMGLLATLGTALALWLWKPGLRILSHSHPDLPDNHPHLLQYGIREHSHTYVIDDNHRVWPAQ
ncbi:MFS transporter [Shimia abyssi]|uniref:Putative MFS family arabinose efflux permease n=1 Tax=Shimia abyssi TaxID=1662395 RepID=A0A2P8F6W0_9RHOB|nr:MFS transporter [Shimia abyssi]PSL17450.1 putative MFS family arabinose efflux permease [Shimia abyssi]